MECASLPQRGRPRARGVWQVCGTSLAGAQRVGERVLSFARDVGRADTCRISYVKCMKLGLPPKRYLEITEYWAYSRVERTKTCAISENQGCCHGKIARRYEGHSQSVPGMSSWARPPISCTFLRILKCL